MSPRRDPDTPEAQKILAAQTAVAFIESGMVVGMGAGSTARIAATQLAERLHGGVVQGLVCVPCAEEVQAHLRALRLPVASVAERPQIDLTIDGADEVDPAFNLIKGLGGALLREKVVAQASRREIIIVDESKLTPRLGTRAPLPVEVLSFGWKAEELFLRGLGLGLQPSLRLTGNSRPFVTDEGNYILDCRTPPLEDPAGLARVLDERAGVAGHGLFLGLATDVIVGTVNGVRHLRPER